MEILTTSIKIDRSNKTSIFTQVSKGIAELIQRGLLKPNEHLPSVRKMAKLLHLHPKTVVAAFADLEAQQWIKTIPRKGIYVSDVLPVISPMKLIPGPNAGHLSKMIQSNNLVTSQRKSHTTSKPNLIVDDGFPDHRLAPIDFIIREYRRLTKNKSAVRAATLTESAGAGDFRRTLSQLLRDTRALPVTEENVFVTRGAQMGLYLICRTFVKKNARVIVGEPNYRLANDVFRECGAILMPVPVEVDGIDVEKIEKICSRTKPDVLYIIPHHHHPTTVTLSPQKRIALLELASKYKFMIIEDDYDFDFNYDTSPILPLASYAKGQNIFYLGSLSKTISNALRVGFICAPSQAINQISNLRRLIDLRGDTFFELAMSDFIKQGEFTRHLRRANRIYKDRRNLMFELLMSELGDVISIRKPPGGMALWTVFENSIDLRSLAVAAANKGIVISDGSFYDTGRKTLNSTRFGFASVNEHEIVQFVDGLKSCIRRMRK